MELFERVRGIILSPVSEWEKIRQEEDSMASVFIHYVLPLALIPAIANFIGYGLIGRDIPFFGVSKGLGLGFSYAVISLLTTTLGVLFTALVVDLLAPSFSSQKNLNKAFQLVAFSYTPAWIGGVLYVFPGIAWVGALFGLYGLYLLYIGIKPMMRTPDDKVPVYFVLSIVVLIVLYFVLSAVLAGIIFGIAGMAAMT